MDEKGFDASGKYVVAVDPRYFRPAEVEKKKLGWTSKITFDELVSDMMREDLKVAERDELVKRHGFSTFNYHE